MLVSLSFSICISVANTILVPDQESSQDVYFYSHLCLPGSRGIYSSGCLFLVDKRVRDVDILTKYKGPLLQSGDNLTWER